MTVYTKQGDKGVTKVFDKKSGKLVGVSKKSCQIRSIGTLDELNSFLGIVISFSMDKALQRRLRELQGDLFTINSILAGSKLIFSKNRVKKLEQEIDEWEGGLPVQKNFIYYGGSRVSSLILYARAITRRAERNLVSYSKKSDLNTTSIQQYINRLSDWLFILARKVNYDIDNKEQFWKGK